MPVRETTCHDCRVEIDAWGVTLVTQAGKRVPIAPYESIVSGTEYRRRYGGFVPFMARRNRGWTDGFAVGVNGYNNARIDDRTDFLWSWERGWSEGVKFAAEYAEGMGYWRENNKGDDMSEQERNEFEAFCRQSSDRQVEGIIEKEQEFADVDEFRAECLQIALDEAASRELDV